MVTQSIINGMSPAQTTAARKIAHSYRFDPAHICYALFDREPHEITGKQAIRLIDAIRIIGQMMSNPNTLYTVDSMLEEMRLKGVGMEEYAVRLTLDHLRRAELATTISGGRETCYRYNAGSIEKARDRYNEEKSILCSPALKEGERIDGIEV